MADTIPQTSKRIQSIDVLRGIIMVVMALDHTRDYFSDFKFEPTDLQHASTIMFFTRWITHFCAPVFIFLSGTSVFLSMGKRAGKKHASYRLLTRGLWLILLELTVVRYGWMFDLNYKFIMLQVIWAIGWSMIFLSALIFLPRPVILTIGLVMIFGHNALDGVRPSGSMSVLWQLLHVQSPITFGNGGIIFVAYPLIPWIGVMAVGYCFGVVLKKEDRERDKLLYFIGISAIVLFVALRFTNLYGDASPWQPQHTLWRTVLSFINCTKYPPSLLYLLMTLGPAITLLPLLEKINGNISSFFKVYGRVPFFYYILHLYLIHCLELVIGNLVKGETVSNFIFSHPGYPLIAVYGVWLSVVLILYYPCRWFMNVKQNNKSWWLSYL